MDRNKRVHEECDAMEAIHDEVVEAHEQEEVVRGVLVDDNGVWVDDEVLV